MAGSSDLRIIGLRGIPEVRSGGGLASLILAAVARQQETLQPDDIVVVTQKVVSKAEGRIADLTTVQPSDFASQYASTYDKDPRLVELILRETERIVRMDRGVLIVQTRHGLICANAGIDASNAGGDLTVTLLPRDPDASAQQLRAAFQAVAGDVAVVLSDTFGRPWRLGQTNVAIGSAGITPLRSYQGQSDPRGRPLQATAIAIIDELAAAAELVMGKLDRVPVAIVRGYPLSPLEQQEVPGARALVRPAADDLFR